MLLCSYIVEWEVLTLTLHYCYCVFTGISIVDSRFRMSSIFPSHVDAGSPHAFAIPRSNEINFYYEKQDPTSSQGFSGVASTLNSTLHRINIESTRRKGIDDNGGGVATNENKNFPQLHPSMRARRACEMSGFADISSRLAGPGRS